MKRSVAWAILGSLLGATLLAALTAHRPDWPMPLPREVTPMMQAESLARDLDLRFSRADYDRYVARWGSSPRGLELTSGDGGRSLGFDSPPLYALVVAPLARWDPARGPMTANALLLALGAILAALTLERRMPRTAPLWVAAAVFASVTFGFVFRVEPAILAFAATAVAFSLVYARAHRVETELPDVYDVDLGEAASSRSVLLRWGGAGALLAIPSLDNPLCLLLLLPALAAAPETRRREGAVGLLAGVLLVGALGAALHLGAAGTLDPRRLESLELASRTGYPDVDFAADEWSETVAHWRQRDARPGHVPDWRFEPALWAWNGLYLLVGRHVGVLPYFAPLLFALGAVGGRRSERGLLWQAVLVAALASVVAYPFAFAGDSPSPGNALFLPLFAALWFLPARPVRPVWVLVPVALAAPFLWPLWSTPRAPAVAEDGGAGHVGRVAERLLPFELTLEALPGLEVVSHERLRILLPDASVRALEGGRLFELDPGVRGRLYVASREPLEAILLEVQGLEKTDVGLAGGEPGETVLWPDGRVGFELRPGGPRASHSTWWSRDRHFFYSVELRPSPYEAAPVTFRLRASAR